MKIFSNKENDPLMCNFKYILFIKFENKKETDDIVDGILAILDQMNFFPETKEIEKPIVAEKPSRSSSSRKSRSVSKESQNTKEKPSAMPKDPEAPIRNFQSGDIDFKADYDDFHEDSKNFNEEIEQAFPEIKWDIGDFEANPNSESNSLDQSDKPKSIAVIGSSMTKFSRTPVRNFQHRSNDRYVTPLTPTNASEKQSNDDQIASHELNKKWQTNHQNFRQHNKQNNFNNFQQQNRAKTNFEECNAVLVYNIPENINQLHNLSKFFSYYGTVTKVIIGVENDKSKSLVCFSEKASAMKVWKSPRPILHNRFVKVRLTKEAEEEIENLPELPAEDENASKKPKIDLESIKEQREKLLSSVQSTLDIQSQRVELLTKLVNAQKTIVDKIKKPDVTPENKKKLYDQSKVVFVQIQRLRSELGLDKDSKSKNSADPAKIKPAAVEKPYFPAKSDMKFDNRSKSVKLFKTLNGEMCDIANSTILSFFKVILLKNAQVCQNRFYLCRLGIKTLSNIWAEFG